MNKQLFEKQANNYNPIYPIVHLEDIIDTISDKSIQWILNNYNHIYVEYSESVAITRNKVPSLLRRNGLWISYNTGKDIVTEWYKGKNVNINDYNQWTDDANWAKFEPLADGKVTYQHLSHALKQLMGKGNTITNFPDEEDITTDGTVLSFKDREYDTNNFSGLGKVILRKNIALIDGVYKNVLTQDMINKSNTIYEIRYDFDLGGATLEIPANCVLDFKGGVISNGKIKGNNTSINASLCKIFDTSVLFEGSFDTDAWYPEWFGAIPLDENIMCTASIQAAINASMTGSRLTRLVGKGYYIDDTLVLKTNQTLEGGTSTPKHYSTNAIYQTANKDAILITSDDDNIWRVSVKNLTIENKYEGSNMSNVGIRVNNGTVKTFFTHSEFINVCCAYFDKGFMYDGYGDGAFAYNFFHCFNAYYNKIGLHIKGNPSSDASVTVQPWANLNRWSFCKFMNNTIGGIYFEGTRSQQENVFESCAIEGNGLNYNLSDYEFYGAGGWGFRGNNKACYGYTRFYNCYVENNLPKRTNDLTYNSEKEYLYNKAVYPIDIETNYRNAAFICGRQSISVEKCLLSKYIRLYSGRVEHSLRFEGNDYDLGRIGYKPQSEKTIDYFFYLHWNSGLINYCNTYINESFNKGDRDIASYPNLLTYMKSVFKLDDSLINYGSRKIRMYVNHPLLEKPIDYQGTNTSDVARIAQGDIYIDPINGVETSGIVTRTLPLKTFAVAEQLTQFFDRGEKIKFRLINNVTMNQDDSWVNGKVKHDINLVGDSGVVYTALKTKIIYTPWIIENVIFDIQLSSWKSIFQTYADKIEFRNCTFNLQDTDQYIIELVYGGRVSFYNCTFNVADTSKGTEIKIQHNGHINIDIYLSNCTIQEGITIPKTNYAWPKGAAIYKRKGDVVAVDGKGFFFYDGADVINPDGTIYSKVARIKDSLSGISGDTLLYKIVKDVDLNGEEYKIPSWYKTFDFQGGKIKNGTISLSATRLLPMGMPLSYYFDTSTVTIKGDWAEGQVIYDSELKKQKLWNGTKWVNLDGTALT